jgi:cytochrome c oxidase assembly protein subunit 15
MSLGIVTLLNYVPIGLAAAHQLGSLIVLSSGIYVVHSLRYVSPAVLKQISSRTATVAASKLGGTGGGGAGIGVATKAMKKMA